MKIKLNHFTNPSFPLISVYVLLGVVLWITAFIGNQISWGTSFNEISLGATNMEQLWSTVASFILTIINAVLILSLVNRFGLLNTRSFLPFFLFFFLIAAWAPTHTIYKSHISLMLFIFALFQFFNLYHNPNPAEKVFLGSFFISIASLLINELIFVIPVCWIGFIIFQSFSLRTFLASLFGVLCPWIIYFGIHYFLFPDAGFNDLLNYNFHWGFNLHELSIGSIIYIAALGIILVITIIGMYMDFHTNTVAVRKSFNFILVLIIFFATISFLQDSISPVFLPFIALCYSIIADQPFTTKKTNFFGILFIIFCVINLLYIIYNFITV